MGLRELYSASQKQPKRPPYTCRHIWGYWNLHLGSMMDTNHGGAESLQAQTWFPREAEHLMKGQACGMADNPHMQVPRKWPRIQVELKTSGMCQTVTRWSPFPPGKPWMGWRLLLSHTHTH